MKPLYIVIMAGGKGERFWPLSRPDQPKPFLNLFSDRSLIQQTFDRALKLVPREQVLLIVGKHHRDIVRQQLPELSEKQIIYEPTGRDTSAAIGYASLHLPQDALMLVMPADHLIAENSSFVSTVKRAAEFVSGHGGPATFGIPPDRPETNYGYIQASAENRGKDLKVHSVLRFVEKPDRTLATEYLAQGNYYWNSGIFLWTVERIQQLLHTHLPELWTSLRTAFEERNQEDFAETYGRLTRISIDFGVMEKADNVVVIPADFPWDDIGTWNSLLRVLPVDNEGNLIRGEHTGLNTSNCIIYSDGNTIATAGVQDLIIVQRGNQTLVCSREYADRLKELIHKLTS